VSLRWRIALTVALLAAMATIAVGAASYRSTRDRLYDEIDRSLDVGGPPGDGDHGGYGSDDEGAPGGAGGPVSRGPSLYELRLLGAGGEVMGSSTPAEIPVTRRALAVVGQAGATNVQTVSADGEQYRVRTIGTPRGARQIVRSLAETNNVLSSLRVRSIFIVLVATALAALIGSLIAGRVTASLRRLTAAADAVRSTGRLDVDVPVEGSDEVSRLGASFRGMLGSLARSREEQHRLVQDAGHELKTPLTSIRTNLDVLRRHSDLPDRDRAQVIEDLHAEVEEMVDLVEEVVAVAAGLANDEPVSTFSLGDTVTEVVDRYQRRSGREFTVDADDSPVCAQPAAVQRAISNLVDNAVKFDPSGGRIAVVVRRGRVDVLDRGPGVSAHEVHLVFERFHRGAEARTLPGSGLGLSIVSDVAARNGGTTHAANRDGGGASIGFTLPVA